MQMKLSVFTSAPVLLVLLAGCQSTGVATSSATVKSLTEVRDALSHSEDKVDNVVQSLNALAKVEGDMKGQWRNYEKAVTAVEADSKRVSELRDEAKERKAAYLKGWEERMINIKDADLRMRAEERRDAATKELDELGKQVDEARDSYRQWMANVVDIRTYLESDLNHAGVQSVADKIEKVTAGAGSLKKEIGDVIGGLDKTIASMRAVGSGEEGEGAEAKKG